MLPHDLQVQDAALPDALFSIKPYLNPAWLQARHIEIVKARLSTGALVVVRDAFQHAFAEFRCLDACTAWKVYEGGSKGFHYRHHNLYVKGDYPADLKWCERVFDSSASRDFAGQLSGRQCTGSTEFSASWYLPGDHSLPHTDAVAHVADENRQVAFIWHLAKEWRPEWGGELFWCPHFANITPRFNSLVLFNVGPDSVHFVTMVSPIRSGQTPHNQRLVDGLVAYRRVA